MPIKLKRKFEREYGKAKGDRIFYAWENKQGYHYPKKSCPMNKELMLGAKIEMEHTKNPFFARKIACDHLKEFPKYYSKGLIPMERKFKKMKGGIR